MIPLCSYSNGDIYVGGSISDWPANTTDYRVTYPNGPALGKTSKDSDTSFPVLSEHQTNPQEFTVYALDSQENVLASKEFKVQA